MAHECDRQTDGQNHRLQGRVEYLLLTCNHNGGVAEWLVCDLHWEACVAVRGLDFWAGVADAASA